MLAGHLTTKIRHSHAKGENGRTKQRWIVLHLKEEAILSYLLVPGAIITPASNIANFRLPEQFPEAWATGFIHLSTRAYKTLIILPCVLNLVVVIISLAMLDLFNLCCNLAMTTLLFLWAWVRIKQARSAFTTESRHN